MLFPKMSTPVVALISSVVAESSVVVGFLKFGRVGSCGSMNTWTDIVIFFHTPGLKLLDLCWPSPSGSDAPMLLLALVGCVQWYALFFLCFGLFNFLSRKPQ